MIAYWKGTIPAGQVRDELVDTTDFVPTIAEAAGLDVPIAADGKAIDGVSFLGHITGKSAKKREWIFVGYTEPRQDSFAALVGQRAVDPVGLLEGADASDLPLLVLLNKADKLGRNAQAKALKAMQRVTETMPLVDVILFSATSGLGNDAVVAWLREHLNAGA